MELRLAKGGIEFRAHDAMVKVKKVVSYKRSCA